MDAPVNLNAPRNISSAKPASFGNGANGGNGKVGFASSFKSVPSNDKGRMPAEEDEFDRLPGMDAGPNGSAATEKQVKAIYAIGRASKRLSEGQVDDRAIEVFGVRPTELTKAEASQFIDMLKGDAAA